MSDAGDPAVSLLRPRIGVYAACGIAVAIAGVAIVAVSRTHSPSAPAPPAAHQRQAAVLAAHERDPRVQPCTRALRAAPMVRRRGGPHTWVLDGTTYTDAQVDRLVACMRKRLAVGVARPGQASLLKSSQRAG
jgi:hypothetical protein